MTWHWPVEIRHELPSGRALCLRPMARADREEWERLRDRNEERLRRWESTVPDREGGWLPFHRMRRAFDRAAREGHALPFVIQVDGRLVGQVQLFDVLWGARRSGLAGYWLDRAATGQGVATWSVAALIDYAILEAGLHRVEVCIRPENTASLAVAARLNLHEEGRARGMMHVDGAWADHRVFAVVAEELGRGGWAADGLVARLRASPR